MRFSMPDLNKSHSVVLASRLMHDLYHAHEGMYEPCKMVLNTFPELSSEQVMCLWVAINVSEITTEEREKIALVGVNDV